MNHLKKEEAIDETKMKILSAIDIDTKECLAILVSKNFVFLRIVFKCCENKPEFVDRETWHPWAFKRLGLMYRHEMFRYRNVVEGFFSQLKDRVLEEIPLQLFLQFQSWLKSFIAFYNYWRILS